MSVTTWIIPRADVPSLPSSLGSGFSFVPAVRSGAAATAITACQDRLIDEVTRDYVRTDDGEWAETADSRTTVLIALSVPVGGSAFDPDDGTAITERVRRGIGVTPEFVRADTIRIMERLARAGILTDIQVAVRDSDGNRLRDDAGRSAVRVSWRDLTSGSPIPLTSTIAR